MKLKEYLTKVIDDTQAKIDSTRSTIKTSQDVNEVRALGETLDTLLNELEDAKKQLAEIETPAPTSEPEDRSFNPITKTYTTKKIETRNEEITSTMEYRNAFFKYATKGEDNEILKRAASISVTGDVGKVIPNTILNEFISKVKGKYGQVYSKVRKLSIQGGVEIPISDLSASATWIAETAVSEEKKAGDIKDSISFKYNTLELRIAHTLLAGIVTLEAFEQQVVELLVEAFAKEMDTMILNGTGSGQPLGILKDSRVTNVIELTDVDFDNWTAWRKKLFAVIPLSKRGGGEFLFTPATWESHILTIKDKNDRPLFKEAAEVSDGTDVGTFFGRSTTLVEPVDIKDFDTAVAGDVVGVFWIPNDYIVNTNLQLAYDHYFDKDKNKFIDKGLVICDGRIADVSGCYIIKKKASV